MVSSAEEMIEDIGNYMRDMMVLINRCKKDGYLSYEDTIELSRLSAGAEAIFSHLDEDEQKKYMKIKIKIKALDEVVHAVESKLLEKLNSVIDEIL